MNADGLVLLAQFTYSLITVIVLEVVFRGRQSPYGDVPLITLSVAATGLIVAARLAWAPLPALEGAALAWWLWWLVFWSFIAQAVPVWAWQAPKVWGHIRELVSYLRSRGRT